jgi:hypothetical protein
MIRDVVVQPVINFVNLPVDPFQQLKVGVVITVVLSAHPFQQDSQQTAGC